MLDKKIKELLSDQMNYELYSSYIYLIMFAYYSNKNLKGFANWFKVQAMEERDHALLQLQYILNNFGDVDFKAVENPGFVYDSIEQPLKVSLEHERKVTKRIYNIYSEASELKIITPLNFWIGLLKNKAKKKKMPRATLKIMSFSETTPKGFSCLTRKCLSAFICRRRWFYNILITPLIRENVVSAGRIKQLGFIISKSYFFEG